MIELLLLDIMVHLMVNKIVGKMVVIDVIQIQNKELI
jgi:hypothetical protein